MYRLFRENEENLNVVWVFEDTKELLPFCLVSQWALSLIDRNTSYL